jgi:hypothetical protein
LDLSPDRLSARTFNQINSQIEPKPLVKGYRMSKTQLTRRMSQLSPAMRAAVIRAAEVVGHEADILTHKRALAIVRSVPKAERGGLTQAAAVDFLLQTGKEIASIRLQRRRLRKLDASKESKTRIAEAQDAGDRRRLACRLAAPLEQRLKQAREEAVKNAAKGVMNWGAPAGTKWQIRLSTTDDVDYELTTWRDYTVYRGQFKGWAAKGDKHAITVRPDWKTRVTQAGCKGGLLKARMLLNVEPVSACTHGTWALYRAVYAERGRGYQVHIKRGIFIRFGRYGSTDCRTKLREGEDFTKAYKMLDSFVRGKVKKVATPSSSKLAQEDFMPEEDWEALSEIS